MGPRKQCNAIHGQVMVEYEHSPQGSIIIIILYAVVRNYGYSVRTTDCGLHKFLDRARTTMNMVFQKLFSNIIHVLQQQKNNNNLAYAVI